ncbi:transglutaminase-like cysteine peptidase [Aestuariibacter sp. AA17]|uniref:Transglutaminase-like cysteine peptidase n=1 Tax=Fluctibacter corallii TaxID=2984329 RepID=A0ABT3A7I3_9ALTE|nr:transglutaminase-like cysteine peptidase [Aestuariibacter sp. AA17]MCV2884537.1 transglutaminase-like cysteine peptidase [Aestuariibacter sp. AA17]
MHKSALEQYTDAPANFVKQWQETHQTLSDSSIDEKIKQINALFNTYLTYKTDIVLWEEEDFWATPLQTIGKAQGDCEDYAIAKYLALLALGVPAEKLRLIYVRAQIGGSRSRIFQAHMVLGYYPDLKKPPIILDSLIDDVLPATQRRDLQPVFSFSLEGIWKPGTTKSAASATDRLSRWSNLLDQVKAEGISL